MRGGGGWGLVGGIEMKNLPNHSVYISKDREKEKKGSVKGIKELFLRFIFFSLFSSLFFPNGGKNRFLYDNL